LKELASCFELSVVLLSKMKNIYSIFNRTDNPKVGQKSWNNLANDRVSPKDISEIEKRARGDAEIHSFHVVMQFAYDNLRASEEMWRASAEFDLQQIAKEAHAVKRAIQGRMD